MRDPDVVRLSMMAVAEMLVPVHEFIAGEVAHFERQGFSREQARAIVAAEYVSAFGLRILNDATDPSATSDG